MDMKTVDSGVTEMQQAFIDGLNKKLQSDFSSQLDGTFETMNVPNGFYWGIQFGPNNFYNENSLNQVNLQAIKGSNDVLTVGNANFTTLYNSLMGDVVFAFSQEDEKSIQQDQTANDSQIQAVINSWETAMGSSITTEQMQSAMPPTKLGYIQGQVESKWDGDVDKIPTSMNDFKVAYQTYQVSAQISFRLLSQSAQGMLRLNAARANSKKATADNGGLQTSSSTYYQPFGPFPTQNKINSGLETLDNKVSISMTLNNFSSKESHFSVEGGAGFTIPVLDFMDIGIGGSSSYTVDKYASSTTTIDTTITYQGVTFISAPLTDSNLNTEMTKGWYANDVLSNAIANPWPSGTNPPKTGYTLKGNQFPISEYFGPGNKFSRIKTWVVSQTPTISMKFCGADTSKIVTDFKEKSHVNVKLFGLFSVGSVNQSYEVKTVDTKSVAGCVIVELGPTKVIGTTPAEDATAYVVGGVPSYPPNNT